MNSSIKILLFCLIALSTKLYAQSREEKKAIDSTASTQSVRIDEESFRQRLREAKKENLTIYRENKAVNIQRLRLDNLRKYSAKVDFFFRRGMDTISVRANTKILERDYSMAVEGILENPDSFLPSRNLTTSELLTRELLDQARKESQRVTSYINTVEQMQLELDSLVADSAIYTVPTDPSKFQYTFDGIVRVYDQLKPIDSLLQRAMYDLLGLDTKLDVLKDKMELSIENIGRRRRSVSANIFSKEVPFIWQPAQNTRSIQEIAATSYKKAIEVMRYFTKNNQSGLSLLVLTYLLLVGFILWCKSSIRKNEVAVEKHANHPVYRHPLLSVSFVITSIGQFLFTFPPFVFHATVWLISALIMLVYIWDNKESSNFSNLLMLIIFLTPVIAINLLLEPFTLERWYILVLAAVGLPFAKSLWKSRNTYYMPARLFGVLLSIFVICEVGTIVATIFGRYNLGKTLLTAGYYTLLSGIFLHWADYLINKVFEVAADAFHTYEQQDIRYKVIRVHKSLKGMTRFFVYLGTFVIFLRNFYLYNMLIDFLETVLEAEREVGTISFTLGNIVIFIFVILLSSLLATIVAFIFDDTNFRRDNERGKGGLKNWTLVAKLSIIIFGIILAFAAANIELGKITLIIGALGVGIGFGLQSIVNNLLSGVVLAFERPIEIGDQIEVAGQLGKVKEIGIRSSKLQNFDGSEVIIPNGDLLSQHVINWTLSNNQRRVELILGVKYGTDLKKVKSLLETVLTENPRIERYPASVVLLHDFGESAITFRLFFWTDVAIWLNVKSEIILAVDECFKQNGIEIPFPQLDIHMNDSKSEGAD